jgi:hypothetical protein
MSSVHYETATPRPAVSRNGVVGYTRRGRRLDDVAASLHAMQQQAGVTVRELLDQHTREYDQLRNDLDAARRRERYRRGTF